MGLNSVFQPFSENGNHNMPVQNQDNTNPAVLVDKMIGTAYDVVKHVCLYMAEVRHVSANLEAVAAVSEDMAAVKSISENMETLDTIIENLDAILALGTDIDSLTNRVDAIEDDFVSKAGGNTINGNNIFAGFTKLGNHANYPGLKVVRQIITGPAVNDSVNENIVLGMAGDTAAYIMGYTASLEDEDGVRHPPDGDKFTLSVGTSTFNVALSNTAPAEWGTQPVTVLFFLMVP